MEEKIISTRNIGVLYMMATIVAYLHNDLMGAMVCIFIATGMFALHYVICKDSAKETLQTENNI